MRSILATFVFACCTATCSAASGGTPDSFSIDWYSIDGGGDSTSGDDSLRLRGSVGQHEPDVVALCSAEAGIECVDPVLQLTGGFWSGIAASAAGTGPGCDATDGCIFADGFESVGTGTPP